MLTLSNIQKTFESTGIGTGRARVVAVDHVDVQVERAQLYTLLGPSGCGKTTTLRSIAGLERPDGGRITLDGRILFDAHSGIDVPTHRRGLGMVFQSYAIWPHFTVFQNTAFPLTAWQRRRHTSRRQIREKVERVLELLDLHELADRPATKLSGGQQQRLALARALVVEPPVLLLDEPLSNLDAKLRERTRFEFKRMQRELNITAVYVTHDQVEALAMSDVIAVMRDGRVEQFGRPRDIYERPRTAFVADFIGTTNFVDGEVKEKVAEGCYLIVAAHGTVQANTIVPLDIGDKVTVSIRPEHVTITAGEADLGAPVRPNFWQGQVDTRGFLGEAVEFRLRVGDDLLRARCNVSVAVRTGENVVIHLPPESCWVLPKAS